MFLGTHYVRLDEKGRLVLPARYRERLREGLVITRGHERCVAVYPTADFTALSEELGRASNTGRGMREFSRFLYSLADDPVPDKQGRVLIRPELRAYAGLDKECVAIGANNRVEIWDVAAWERFVAEREQAFADLETEVLPGVM